MASNRYWFAPKAYGYGSGLPIRWEGWTVLAVFFALVLADMRFAPTPWRAVGLVLLVVACAAVSAWKTEGGWRWRWGRD